MASPKKIQPKKIIKTTLIFLAGLALPVSLAVGWHVAYGQQDAPDKPRQAYTGSPQRVPQPYQPGPVATNAPQPQAKPALPAQPAAQAAQAAQAAMKPPVNVASVEQAPTVPAGDELDDMRRIFSSTVQQPNMERMDRYIKGWKNAPKVQQALEDRRNRLARMDKRFLDFVREDVSAQLKQRGMTFERSQYFVYADRNPKTQFVLVGFYDSDARHIEFLGADLMSSGNLDKGGDYYVTPTGVFENLVDNFGYRALGTPNQEGWRGLGAKDSRVWDFGDQKSVKKYKGGNTVSQMRLLMHSTDPDKGEPRLGRTDSKGCVRISHTLNHFLDTYAILDLNYEQWAKTRPESWLLKKDRRPVSHPGKFLIVGDSSSYFTAQATP